MDIYAKKGDKVIFLNRNGHDWQPKQAVEIGLVEGNAYTVDHTKVYSCSTDVYLEEFPGVSFNSVMFRDVKTYTEQEYNDMENHYLEQLEVESKVEKVPLPKEIAEAINVCEEAGISKFGIITLMDRVSSLFRDYSKPVLDALTVIRDYAWRNIGGGDRLLNALVNGYTVEEPTVEDKLLARIEGRLIRYNTSSGVPLKTLAAVILHEVREVLAEHRE